MGKSICVVGAGIMGAAVAAALAEAGAEVTVVSRDPLGRDTSSASFAWLNALEKTPAHYAMMNINGMKMHRAYADRHGHAPWYHTGGNLHFTYGGRETERQREIFEEMSQFNYRAKWLDSDETLALEPDLSREALDGATISYFPEEGWISGALLIARLLADLRKAGGTVLAGVAVTEFARSGDAISQVLLSNGERLDVDMVVNCAGPAAGQIARLAGADIPMKNEVGVQIYTAPAAVTLNRVIHSANLNIRPDGAGRICLHDFGTDAAAASLEDATGADIEGTASAYRYDLSAAQPLADRLARFYPGTRGVELEAARIGLRPIPRDRRPVVGFQGGADNFYSAVMHSGVTQSLWIGELVKREVMEGIAASELEPYRPDRFAAPSV